MLISLLFFFFFFFFQAEDGIRDWSVTGVQTCALPIFGVGEGTFVFLPSTSSLEKEGTFTNTDRRVQRVRAVIAPMGQSRPDWEVICDLAGRIERKLGVTGSAYWGFESPAEVLQEMSELVPSYAGVTYDRLDGDGLQWPVPTREHPGTPFLFAESFPRGRGKFHALAYEVSAETVDAE